MERRLAEVEEALNTQKFLLWKLETMAHKEIEALRAVEAKVDCTIRRVEDVVDVVVAVVVVVISDTVRMLL